MVARLGDSLSLRILASSLYFADQWSRLAILEMERLFVFHEPSERSNFAILSRNS